MSNMLLEISGEITPENMRTEPKQKQHPVVDVTGGGSIVQHCKELFLLHRNLNVGSVSNLLGP